MDKALVLFSGGFDSVAVAHKVITSKKHKEVHLLFNDSENFSDKEVNAKEMAKKLKKIGRQNKVKVKYKRINTHVPYENIEDITGRDMCLLTHISTLTLHSGDYKIVYIGWNKNNVGALKYSKQALKTFEVMTKGELELIWLEELYFNTPKKASARDTKREVIEDLLNAELFIGCQTGDGIVEGNHWFDGSEKWKEVMFAIIDLGFTNEEMIRVFSNNDIAEIQTIWNEKTQLDVEDVEEESANTKINEDGTILFGGFYSNDIE